MAKYASHCPKLPWMIDFHSSSEGQIPNSQLQAAYASNFTEHLANLNFKSQIPSRILTGIICTLGPTSNDEEILEKMMAAGMTMIRIKMCHYDHEQCLEMLNMIRKANDNYSRRIGRIYPLAIGLDIKGPQILTGTLKDPQVQEIELVQGNTINITSDPAYEEHVTEDMIYVDYQNISEIIEPGDRLYIHDGEIRLSALEIVGSIIECIIENAGKLVSRASVSLPGLPVDLPVLSEKDIKDINFGILHAIDAIFVSGIRKDENIKQVRDVLDEAKKIMIISKIDNSQALDNLESIIKHSDAILIDRGTLGTEIPQEKLFLIQKSIIAKCNMEGKPVICATQILDSMLSQSIPTKSEISDVANAILDGADSFMLSKETSIGQYPVESILNLSLICKEAEPAIYQRQVLEDLTRKVFSPIEPIYALAISAVEASLKCNAAIIIVLTTSGRSAKILAQYKPRCPIVAITRLGQSARQLNLYRAIDPIQYIKPPKNNWEKDVESRIQLGITWGKVSGFVRAGDAMIIVRGSRPGSGFTNAMSILYASEFDALPHDEQNQ